MTRNSVFNTIAIISTLGIFCWMITEFFGGMIIHLLSYGLLIIPIIILYIFSFFETIVATSRRGMNANKIKVVAHGLLIFSIILLNGYQSELFKSKKILTATLKDELYHHTLVFRENGNCENEVNGMFFYHEVFHGKYKFYGDTIVFEKKPYDNDFISDTLLIDRSQKAIFIKKDKAGNFPKKMEWLNHFKIANNID